MSISIEDIERRCRQEIDMSQFATHDHQDIFTEILRRTEELYLQFVHENLPEGLDLATLEAEMTLAANPYEGFAKYVPSAPAMLDKITVDVINDFKSFAHKIPQSQPTMTQAEIENIMQQGVDKAAREQKMVVRIINVVSVIAIGFGFYFYYG